MIDKTLLESLENTAFTTGAGANCFFQGFIHTLCYIKDPDAINNMDKFPGSTKLLELFNQKVPELKVKNIKNLILLAKAMHPLERELIFGPLMRDTLNELKLNDSNEKPLPFLNTGSIIFPPHAVALAHAFGFSYDEYTHKNDSEGMPPEFKKDMVGDYYRVSYSMNNSVGTLVLKLKSCHFEVGGLNPDEVILHQSKIKELVFEGDGNRPEQPGANYYEAPSPNSECAVKDCKVDFDTAVALTIPALRLREGEHQKLMTPNHNIPTAKDNFSKFKETYISELEGDNEKSISGDHLSKPS